MEAPEDSLQLKAKTWIEREEEEKFNCCSRNKSMNFVQIFERVCWSAKKTGEKWNEKEKIEAREVIDPKNLR